MHWLQIWSVISFVVAELAWYACYWRPAGHQLITITIWKTTQSLPEKYKSINICWAIFEQREMRIVGEYCGRCTGYSCSLYTISNSGLISQQIIMQNNNKQFNDLKFNANHENKFSCPYKILTSNYIPSHVFAHFVSPSCTLIGPAK